VESDSTVHWKITTRKSKMLLFQTCSTAAKIDGSYQKKLLFFLLSNTDICDCGETQPQHITKQCQVRQEISCDEEMKISEQKPDI